MRINNRGMSKTGMPLNFITMIILDSYKCFFKKLKKMFQEKLVSGENIKTINGMSILGDGDIKITEGGIITDDYLSKKAGGTVEGDTAFSKPLILKEGLSCTGGENGDTETIGMKDGVIKVTSSTEASVFLYVFSDGIRSSSHDSGDMFYATDGTVMAIDGISNDEIKEISKI